MGKGRTTRPSEGEEWIRKYLELEIKLPEQFTEKEFQETLIRSEYLLDQWLGSVEVEAGAIPQLDIGEIDSLVWMSYKTKQPCTKPDEPAWTFTNPTRHQPEKQKIVSELISALEKDPQNKLELGNVLYTFSGPKEDPKLFISRKPVNEVRKLRAKA